MGNLMRNLLILSLLFMTACGQNVPEVLERRNNLNEKTELKQLQGNLNLTTNEVLQLSTISKTSVFFFVSESCTSCLEETKEMVALFQSKGLPQNVQIYSVLIGSTLPDTIDWVNSLSVPWQVGFDENLFLYKTYFHALITPSIVIYQADKQKVISLQGKKTLTEIQQETGTWEY